MTDENKRSRPAPVERFAGTEHVFDLAETVERLRREPSTGHGGHRQVTLFKHPTATMSVFDFEAGGGLAEHQANGFVTIQVLQGRLGLKTPDHEHHLTAGQVLVMAPGVRHSVSAAEPSQMLLIVNLSA